MTKITKYVEQEIYLTSTIPSLFLLSHVTQRASMFIRCEINFLEIVINQLCNTQFSIGAQIFHTTGYLISDYFILWLKSLPHHKPMAVKMREWRLSPTDELNTCYLSIFYSKKFHWFIQRIFLNSLNRRKRRNE